MLKYKIYYRPEVGMTDILWATTKDRAFAERYFQECIKWAPDFKEVYILKVKSKKIQNMRRR